MSTPFQELLSQSLPLAGVTAWAVRMPDFAVGQECLTEWFTADQVAQFLARMIQSVENLNRHHIQPLRLCWTFEHARVHLASRPDGACLALFVENRTDLPLEDINQLLNDFLALPEI